MALLSFQRWFFFGMVSLAAFAAVLVWGRGQHDASAAQTRFQIDDVASVALPEARMRARLHLRDHPEDPQAHLLCGHLALDALDNIGAALHFRDALLLKNTAAAQTGLGIVARRQHRYDAAITHYRQALVLDPLDAPALSSLGRLLATHGSVEEALLLTARARAIAPADPIHHVNAAVAFHVSGRWKKRDAAIARARRLGFTWGENLMQWFARDEARPDVTVEAAF